MLVEWWRDVVRAMPIVQAIRRIRGGGRRERGAVALLAVIGFYALVAVATPHCGPLQRELFRSYHYRPSSMASWVVLQPAPKMYGFANRVWRGPFLLADPRTSKVRTNRFDATAFWVNHYPARMARYDGERGRVFAQPGRTVYVVINSRYRDGELWTALEVAERDGALQMRTIGVTP